MIARLVSTSVDRLVQRAIGRDGNHRPFWLRRTGAAVSDRLRCCWKRHAEVRRLSVITEADFRDGAFNLIASHDETVGILVRFAVLERTA
jgi:hypothetical protein